MTRDAVKALAAGALLVYPLAMYFAAGYLTPSQLLAGLLILLALRIIVAVWVTKHHVVRNILGAMVLIAGAVAVLLAFRNVRMDWLRFYPMVFDFAVFALFFGSLFTGQPLAERFARMVHHDMEPRAVVYARYVTWGWSCLMLLITLVSLYTTIGASFRVWSLFNGLVVYGIMAGAFVCEYGTRRYLKRKWSTA